MKGVMDQMRARIQASADSSDAKDKAKKPER